MESTSSKNWSIQDYLSLGYLFLLILGILRNVIYFGFLGINIIDYSDLMDILLSPLSFIADNMKIPIALITVVLFIFGYVKLMSKLHQKHKTKKWYKKMFNVSRIDDHQNKSSESKTIIFFIVLMITSFFLGSGIGSGVKKSQMLKSKDFKTSHKLTFNDKEELQVKIFGQNSNYIFYALKNTNKIIVSPIQNNITKIEKLDE